VKVKHHKAKLLIKQLQDFLKEYPEVLDYKDVLDDLDKVLCHITIPRAAYLQQLDNLRR
jgi:hypothetical protein